MTTNELIRALEHMQVETGSLVCLGCGHENSCSVKGCAIIREVAGTLKYAVSARGVQALIVSEFAETQSDEVEDALIRLYKGLKVLQRDNGKEESHDPQ